MLENINNLEAYEIFITSEEREKGRFFSNKFDKAVETLRNEGCLFIRDCFDKNLLGRVREYVVPKDNAPPLVLSQPKEFDRSIHYVYISKSVNSPELYANNFVLPLVEKIIGDDLILKTCGLFVSPPGAKDQAIHRDHPSMFSDDFIAQFSELPPPFDIKIFIPLIDLNEQNGPTRIWPKTHLLNEDGVSKVTDDSGYIDAYMKLGDCLLFDCRLLHRGVRNLSKSERPLLHLTFSQPWFRDTSNYYRLASPEMSLSEFQNIPEPYKKLFRHFHGDYRESYLN